jgi:hypothetical protein
MIKVAVMYHVDSFTLVELAFDLKKMFVHGLSRAEFVNKPEILFVFNGINEHT